MPRALHRSPLFSEYDYVRGRLVRKETQVRVKDLLIGLSRGASPETHGVTEPTIIVQKKSFEVNRAEEVDAVIVSQRLRSNDAAAKSLCLSLTNLISEWQSNTAIPNDPMRLNQYEEFGALLNEIRLGLEELSISFDEKLGAEKTDKSVSTVISMRQQIDDWWRRNGSEIGNYGVSLGLIGAGTAFLTLCGAPPYFATGISAALHGSRKVMTFLTKSGDASMQ
jgi:hypothetical protein